MCTQFVFCFDIQSNLCTQHVLSLQFLCTELSIQWTIFCHIVVSWCKNKCFWKIFTYNGVGLTQLNIMLPNTVDLTAMVDFLEQDHSTFFPIQRHCCSLFWWSTQLCISSFWGSFNNYVHQFWLPTPLERTIVNILQIYNHLVTWPNVNFPLTTYQCLRSYWMNFW